MKHLCLLFLLINNISFASDKIKNCDAAHVTALEAVDDYIDQNLNDFLSTSATFISTKHRDAMKKKWPKTTLKCANADKYCAKKGFSAFKSVGKVVRYCTKEIDIPAASLCRLVSLTIHELGHIAAIPIHNRHNHSSLYSQVSSGTSDLVYKLGAAARTYCNNNTTAAHGGMSTAVVASRALGAKCKKNNECNSGKCQGSGDRRECVCKKNSDCVDGRCQNRAGKNYCVKKGTGPGDYCKKNKDCDFGKCEKRNCVCNADSQCRNFFGDNSMRCAKPATKKNFCQPTGQGLDQSCQKNSDCSNNRKCKKKKCSN